MKCITSNWGCAYHACMSNDCQKEEMLKYNREGFGKGECEKEYCRCEMPAKVHGKNKCWRCKKPFKEFQKQII